MQDQYSLYDFDSKKDEGMARAASNVKRTSIIKSATSLFPVIMFGWIDQHICAYFNNPATSAFDIAHLASCLENVMASIPIALAQEAPKKNVVLFERIGILLEAILSLNVQDSSIIIHQLPMIASFSPLMELYPETVFKCLEKV